MSRCFPFPPPGYEKKARAEDADLLKKEKQREKKHKKERKDKEKKEKKEKDKSEGKDREKKDKKEKHRDKKKDKEVVKDKYKNNSDEKKLAGKSEDHHNGGIFGKSEGTEKGEISFSNEKRFLGKSVGDHGEKLSQNIHLAEDTKNSRFVQELGRRISNGAENHSAIESFVGTDRNKDEKDVRLVVAKDFEGKEKQKDKNGVDRRMVGQRSRDEAESSGNTMLQNLPGVVHGKPERLPRPLERNIENKEGNDKTKKEGSERQGDNRTDKDRDKKSKDKDKNRDKEKKKEEKMKLKESSLQKIAETDRLKENYMNSHSNKKLDLSKDIDMADAIDGNLRKRKDLEANGFCHAIDVTPHLSSSHTLVENGRVMEPCQTPLKLNSDRQVIPVNHVAEKKKQKVNGVIEGHSISESSMKSTPSTAVKIPKNGVTEGRSIYESSMKPTPSTVKLSKSSIKPPHPDSKYLAEILSVPKMEEWSDVDDQEWLLSTKTRPKLEDSGIDETPQVWDAALQIDSADICVLPYVIPY